MRHVSSSLFHLVSTFTILFATSSWAAETCTLSAPLKVATEPTVGPKRVIWRTLPAGTLVDVTRDDKGNALVHGGGVTGTTKVAAVDVVCAPPRATPPPPPPAPPVTTTITPPPAPTTTTATVPTEKPAKPQFLDRPRVVVIGTGNVSLDAALVAEVKRDSQIDVVTPSDVAAVLDDPSLKLAKACDDVACATIASNPFGAQLVIASIVDGKQLRLASFDIVHLTRPVRVSRDVVDGDFTAAMRPTVAALYGIAGRIRLWDQPPGAELFLDGQSVGETPVPDLQVHTPGAHTIAVKGPGVLPWSTSVDVKGGADVEVRIAAQSVDELESERTWWRVGAGSLLGAGALTAAGAVAFYGAAMTSDARLDTIDARRATQTDLDAITGETTRDFIASMALVGTSLGLAAGAAATWFFNPPESQLP